MLNYKYAIKKFTNILGFMELQLECPSWIRVALATFPSITVRARMENLVGISLGLPSRILHGYQKNIYIREL